MTIKKKDKSKLAPKEAADMRRVYTNHLHILTGTIESLREEIKDLRQEVMVARTQMSDLNNTVYEDRFILAKFVGKFMHDDTFLDPKIAIDGGRKAKK